MGCDSIYTPFTPRAVNRNDLRIDEEERTEISVRVDERLIIDLNISEVIEFEVEAE